MDDNKYQDIGARISEQSSSNRSSPPAKPSSLKSTSGSTIAVSNVPLIQKPTPAKARVRRSHRKSRRGCLSCKRLRIKCDEARPICEYCLSTNKICEYPLDVEIHKASSTLTLEPATLNTAPINVQESDQKVNILNNRHQPQTAQQQLKQEIISTTASPIPPSQQISELDPEYYENSRSSSVSAGQAYTPLLECDNIVSTYPGSRIPLAPRAPTSQFFRNIPYGEILAHHRSHVSTNLALTEQSIFNAWSYTVPQMAYNSPMVAHAVVAYAALTMSRNLPARDPSLEFLASTNFNATIRLLGPLLPNINSSNYENIHITSCLVGAYAFIDPDVAPLASADPQLPDLFGILRGVFNISAFAYAELAQNSPIAVTFLHKAINIPTLNDLKKINVNDKNIGYFKLLLDQLDSMAAGSKDISILCEPVIIPAPEMSAYKSRPSDIPFQEPQQQTSPQAELHSQDLSNLQAKFTPRLSTPEGSSLPTVTSSSNPAQEYQPNSPQDDDMFTLTPGELEIYRVVVYSLMFIAQESVRINRPSLLTGALNAPPDDYLRLLRLGRPMAIILAAFMLGQYEFMMAFPDYKDSFLPRMKILEASLPAEWRPAMYWPKRILEEGVYQSGLLQLMEDLHLR